MQNATTYMKTPQKPNKIQHLFIQTGIKSEVEQISKCKFVTRAKRAISLNEWLKSCGGIKRDFYLSSQLPAWLLRDEYIKRVRTSTTGAGKYTI